MSVKVMGMVFDLEIKPMEKLLLLAYADHADHEGGNIYPAVASVARKTGLSERSVQRLTRDLENTGFLLPEGTGTHGTNRWRIPICGGSISPFKGGDSLAGVTLCPPGVTGEVKRGDIAVSPEPSLTIIKRGTTTTGEIFKTYESEIGLITPRIADAIGDDLDYLKIPPEWFLDAIKEAALQNKRNWAYIHAILKRWSIQGRVPQKKLVESEYRTL